MIVVVVSMRWLQNSPRDEHLMAPEVILLQAAQMQTDTKTIVVTSLLVLK